MKKFIAAAVLAGLATAAFAQSQVDVANLFVAADLTAAYPTTAAKGSLLSQKMSSNEATATYTYTQKLDDSNTIKAGAIIDWYLPFVKGTDTAYQPQYSAFVAPFVQYQGFGIDAKATFPMITFAPGDATNAPSGYSAGTNYNAVKYGAITKTGTYKAKDNTFVMANYQKVTYKYSFDKTTAVVVGYEADFAFMPVFWVSDVLPQFSVIYGAFQLDNKFDFYNTWSDVANNFFTQFYLEPKITYDLGSVGVSGLKAYVVGRYSAATTDAKFANASLPWHDSRVQPGASYSFTVKDVGTFGADASVRFNRIDYDATNKFDTAGQGDFRLNLTYSVKF